RRSRGPADAGGERFAGAEVTSRKRKRRRKESVAYASGSLRDIVRQRTMTSIGKLWLIWYVRRSMSRVRGCCRPLSSVARASGLTRPGAAGTFHSQRQRRQTNGSSAASSFASDHVLPPSVLTSTFATADSPAQAAPKTG